MTRRGFVGAIAAAFVAPDPEQLLWRPGARLISVPRAARFDVAYGYGWIRVASLEDVRRSCVSPALRFHPDAFVLSVPPRAQLEPGPAAPPRLPRRIWA